MGITEYREGVWESLAGAEPCFLEEVRTDLGGGHRSGGCVRRLGVLHVLGKPCDPLTPYHLLSSQPLCRTPAALPRPTHAGTRQRSKLWEGPSHSRAHPGQPQRSVFSHWLRHPLHGPHPPPGPEIHSLVNLQDNLAQTAQPLIQAGSPPSSSDPGQGQAGGWWV